MATLQGLTICPAIHSRQAGTYIMVVNEPVRKTTALKSRFLGCNRIRGWKAIENSRFCVSRRMAIQCTFSSSSNDNGSKAENYSENDEDYVNSSVLEAVEVKSGSEGFTIKMRDGKLLKCTHNNPQSGHLPDYASHPAIVLKMEDETGLLLPIIVLEMPSVLLMAAIRNVHIARPTMYHVIKEMVEKMGYAVKLVRVTQRVHEAYFAQIYLTKIDNEEECITLDLRPSDAINIAVRCQVPIQVNKHLAYSDGMRVVEAAKLPAYGPGSDGFLLTEMDRASGQTSVETEEFNLLRNMVEAATEERYQDAAKYRNELTRLRAKRNWAMAEDSSDKMIYLHGDLDLTIVAARRLPNMDLASERFRRCFAPCTGSGTRGLPSAAAAADIHHTADGEADIDRKAKHHGKIITSDPYVAVVVPQATVARTRVIPNSQNPKWDEHFLIPLAHPLVSLEFQVKDNDFFGAQLIGTVFIPASRIASGERIVDWFMIADASGNPPKPESALRLDMKFTPCEKNPIYSNGIGGDPEHAGVRNTYFPLRKGCSVKLYQDAHVVDNLLPDIELESGHRDGKIYRHGTCWEDICYAISEAHHLIYLVGWSIFHKIKLVREPTRPVPRGGDLTLGDLLRYKSEEGVRVLLLVWDDKTSHNKYFINTEGVMQTHDEETRNFFKHSTVTCVLAPRYASSKLSFIKQQNHIWQG